MVQTRIFVLLERLREVLVDQPVTETELRTLIEQADGLGCGRSVRTWPVANAGSPALTDDPDSSLKEIAAELHRVDGLRPRLEEARVLFRGARDSRAKLRVRPGSRPPG